MVRGTERKLAEEMGLFKEGPELRLVCRSPAISKGLDSPSPILTGPGGTAGVENGKAEAGNWCWHGDGVESSGSSPWQLLRGYCVLPRV